VDIRVSPIDKYEGQPPSVPLRRVHKPIGYQRKSDLYGRVPTGAPPQTEVGFARTRGSEGSANEEVQRLAVQAGKFLEFDYVQPPLSSSKDASTGFRAKPAGMLNLDQQPRKRKPETPRNNLQIDN